MKIKTIVIHVLVALCLFVSFGETAMASDWPQWRGPNRDSTSPETDLNLDWVKTPPRKMWSRELGIGYSSPVVASDRLYAMDWAPNRSGEDTIWCLNAETGAVIWKHTYIAGPGWSGRGYIGLGEYMGPKATPCVNGDRIYTISAYGLALCLNAVTGDVLWQRNLEQATGAEDPNWWENCASPIVMGEVAVFGVGAAGVGVDKMTGKILWGYRGGQANTASPVPVRIDDKDYVAISGYNPFDLFIVDPANGKILRTFSGCTGHDGSEPVIFEDKILTTGQENTYKLFPLTGGNQIWKSKFLHPYWGIPMFYQGYIYSPTQTWSYNHHLVCVDPKDGSLVWRTQKEGPNEIIMAQGKLICAGAGDSDAGDGLLMVDPSPTGYKPEGLARSGTKFGMPALSDGRLFYRDHHGITAWDIRAPSHPRYKAQLPSPLSPLPVGEGSTQPPPVFLPPTDKDWRQWRGPNRDGIAHSGNLKLNWLAGQPKELWRTNVGPGFSGVVVSGERIYALGWDWNDGNRIIMQCLNSTTGQTIWRNNDGPRNPDMGLLPKYVAGFGDERKHYTFGPRATPALEGNCLYILDQAGNARCVDAASGKTVWKKSLMRELEIEEYPAWFFSGSPLVLDKVVVFAVGTAGAALDKTTGNLVWSTGTAACGNASPVRLTQDGQERLAMFGKNKFYILKADTGKILWSQDWMDGNGRNMSDPVMMGEGKVLLSGGNGKGSALLMIGTNQPVWEQKAMDPEFDTPILYQGFLYGSSQTSDELICLDANTGAVQWHEKMDATQVTLADGILVIQCRNGEVRLAEAFSKGYKLLGSYQPLQAQDCLTPPTISGGRMYCRSGDGDLVALDLTTLMPLPVPIPPSDLTKEKLTELYSQMNSPQEAKRIEAIEVLAGTLANQTGDLLPKLVQSMRSDRWLEQTSASQVLRKLGTAAKSTAPDIVAMANDAVKACDWDTAALAMNTLWDVDPASLESVAPAMIAALKDQDQDVCRPAIQILDRMGFVTADITGAAQSLLGTQKRLVNQLLKRMGPAGAKMVPGLVETIERRRADASVVQALGAIGPDAKAAIPALVKYGNAPRTDRDTRQLISNTLEEIKTTANIPPQAQDAQVKCTEGSGVTIPLDCADEDDIQTSIKAEIVEKPSHGTVQMTGAFTVEYQAVSGYVGTDTFTWKASDESSESRTATVTVEICADTEMPVVESVAAAPGFSGAMLFFNKALDQTSAEQTAHYQIDNGVTVTKATVGTQGKMVTLDTSKLKEGDTYTLTLTNLRDRTSKANPVEATPIKFPALTLVPGITGEYFEKQNFTGKVERKIDTQVNFTRDKPLGGHYVRWTGKIKPKYSEAYTFSVNGVGEAARLWVNGIKIIDAGNQQVSPKLSGIINLQANQYYEIQLEFCSQNNTGLPVLSWSSASNKQEVIPGDCLFTMP